MINRIVTMSLFLLLAIPAQANRFELSPEKNQVSKKGIIQVSADWIKDKGDKFDVRWNMENISKSPIIVLLADIGCIKGKLRGSMRHTFFNTGEKTIDFNGGEKKSMTLVCRVDKDAMGTMKVLVRKVYANKSGDGKTRGKVIATNITWKPE